MVPAGDDWEKQRSLSFPWGNSDPASMSQPKRQEVGAHTGWGEEDQRDKETVSRTEADIAMKRLPAEERQGLSGIPRGQERGTKQSLLHSLALRSH